MDCKCLVCNYQWKTIGKNRYPSSCRRCKKACWDFGTNIKCYVCNQTLLIPVIHHMDGNHKHNIKENRIPICMFCHKLVHQEKKSARYGHSNQKTVSLLNIQQLIMLRHLQEQLYFKKIIPISEIAGIQEVRE